MKRKKGRRIATYSFYDPKGEVARHKLYYLSQLVKFADRLIIICTGTLTDESQTKLKKFSKDIIVCGSNRLDIRTHKPGLEYIGWDKLSAYDEYLLCSDTCYGPIIPFEELFTEMGKRESDFWGIICDSSNITEESNDYSKHFLLGTFIKFNSKLLKSIDFNNFWDILDKNPDSETFIRGQTQAAYFFQKRGYVSDGWLDIAAFRERIVNITENIPCELLKFHRMPLLDKMAVNGQSPLSDMWDFSYGDEPYRALEYIDKHTDYDVNLIWEDILRTNHLSEIKERLQLTYIISDKLLEREYIYNKKIAVICHIYYADLVEECAAYSENFPENTDFYIAATSEETLTEIHREYGRRGLNYTAQIRPNVGFDIPTLCVTYAHIAAGNKYDYICYFHDKKSTHIPLSERGRQFKLHCYESIFGTEYTVKNIINKFEDNPRMGILSAGSPYHSIFFNIENKTWGLNFDKIKKLADMLELNVPLERGKREPMTAGSMFWFRPKAMKKLLTYGFSYDNFAADVFADQRDMSLAHAMERLFSLTVQDSGYYYAHSVSSSQARGDLMNYTSMLFGSRGIMPAVEKYIAPYDTYNAFINVLDTYLQKADSLDGAQRKISELNDLLSNHLFDIINTEDYLETVSTKLLLKKIVKRMTPNFIWRTLNNLKWCKFKKKNKL